MKNFLILFLLAFRFGFQAQTCTAYYLSTVNSETVAFHNYSSVSNAHYYWNFGDGTSSYFKNPIHLYPAHGTYLATLYVHDTLTNCSHYYETWLTVVKQSTNNCVISLTDSIWTINPTTDKIKLKDVTTDCEGFTYRQYYLTGSNGTNSFLWGPYPSLLIGNVAYYYGSDIIQAVKTVSHRFNRSKNYTPCSANFEYSVISEIPGTRRIFFKAMNKNAASYTWYITGFGDPIIKTKDTVYFDYPVMQQSPLFIPSATIVLKIQDQNGCRDSLQQQICETSLPVTIDGLREIELSSSNIFLMPNPSKDFVWLEHDPGMVSVDRIEILNPLGQRIFAQDRPEPKQRIDLSNLADGIYLLTASNSNSRKTFKILKD